MKPFPNSVSFVQNTNPPMVFMSDCKDEQGRIEGSLQLLTPHTQALTVLSEVLSDYDHLQATIHHGYLLLVYTVYKNGLRSLYLRGYKDSAELYCKRLSCDRKLDSVCITVHNEQLYIAYEDYRGVYTELCVVSVEICTGEILQEQTATKNERAYKPALVSAEGTLYLAYEAFYTERYHIMLRVLQADGRFSQGVEVGCCELNDLSPSLFAYNGAVYLSWENSSPLYKDYVWQPPNPGAPSVYMPSFGHGWRVFTKPYCKKLLYKDGTLSVMSILEDQKVNPPLAVQTDEASGEPVCFILNDTLFVLLVEYDNNHRYQAALWYYDGVFKQIPLSFPHLYERKALTFTLADQRLYLAIDNPYEDCAFPSIDLSVYKGKLPLFVEERSVKLCTLSQTPAYTRTEQREVTIDGQTYKLFWGDLHMHSNTSVCSRHSKFHCSFIKDKNRISRDIGRLDFALLTDHECMSDYAWDLTKKYADFNNQDRAFACFLGYEWTSSQLTELHNYGHYNVLYRQDGQLRRIQDKTFDQLETLWQALSPQDAITIPHHPSDKVHPLDWDFFNPDFVPLVEIYQVRGSYEYDGCEFDPNDYGREIKQSNSVHTGLNRGYRFGFTAGGEHEGVGITGVFAKELTRDSVFEALKAGRVYGTTSEKIDLTFFADQQFMGGSLVKSGSSVEICGTVLGTDEIESIKLVHSSGELDITEHYSRASGDYHLSIPIQSIRWLYVRVKQRDGNIAWSSPIFIDSKQCEKE